MSQLNQKRFSPQGESYSPPPQSSHMTQYPHNYINNNSPPPTNPNYYNQNMHNNNNFGHYQQQQGYWNGNNNMYSQQNPQFYQHHPYPQYGNNFCPSNQNHMQQPNHQGNYHNFNHNQRNFKKNKNHDKKHQNRSLGEPSNKKQKSDHDQNIQDEKVFKFCEICDRDFKTQEKYDEHCATHKTCSVEGCKFMAAEKLVKIHYQNFHASGVDKKIPVLNTPEEIQKYRNERKKNFPTNVNVEKKAHIVSDRVERGAVLETRQFGRFNKNKKRNFSNDENIETKTEIDTTGDKNSSTVGTISKSESSDKLCSPINENTSANKHKSHNNKTRKNKNKNKTKTELKLSRKPTLLQQLLADEIRHERNIILQCVRYVVQSNFFEPNTNSLSHNVLNVSKNQPDESSERIIGNSTDNSIKQSHVDSCQSSEKVSIDLVKPEVDGLTDVSHTTD